MASSKALKQEPRPSSDEGLLEFDLVAQLAHMAALASTGLARERIFHLAGQSGYTCSGYFRQVHLVARQLNYDFARACERVARDAKDEPIRTLLLRLVSSLYSGEPEAQFLAREAKAQMEMYSARYERSLESLRGWTDAYSALLVSTSLIVVVAVISTLIYSFGPSFVIGLVGVTILSTILGGWIIYRVSPMEKTTLPHSERLAWTVAGGALLLAVGLAVVDPLDLDLGLGPGLALFGLMMAPIGISGMRQDAALTRRDQALSPLLRSLGGVASALHTTVAEALSRLDRRAIGALELHAERLHQRLNSGLRPDLCWERFIEETGSEVARRSVSMFYQGMQLGGEPDQLGAVASDYSVGLEILRAKRALVAQTFTWMLLPMHLVLTGLLLLIVEIVSLFGAVFAAATKSMTAGSTSGLTDFGFALAVSPDDVAFIRQLLLLVLIIMSLVNALAMYAASGGPVRKFFFYAALMFGIAGLNVLGVPEVVHAFLNPLLAKIQL